MLAASTVQTDGRTDATPDRYITLFVIDSTGVKKCRMLKNVSAIAVCH